MIKYIIDNTSSKTDIYGNRYHFARITRTRDGKSLSVRTDAPCNIMHDVKEAFKLEWGQVHDTESEVSINWFNQASKNLPRYRNAKELRKLFISKGAK